MEQTSNLCRRHGKALSPARTCRQQSLPRYYINRDGEDFGRILDALGCTQG